MKILQNEITGTQTSFSINIGGKLRFNKISLLCGYHWKRGIGGESRPKDMVKTMVTLSMITLVCCKVKPGVQGEVHWSRFQAITVIRNQSVTVFSVHWQQVGLWDPSDLHEYLFGQAFFRSVQKTPQKGLLTYPS
jgi:hypothetical protein